MSTDVATQESEEATGSVMNFLEDENYDPSEDGEPEVMAGVLPPSSTFAEEVEESEEYATIGADSPDAVDLISDTFRSEARRNPNAPKYGRTFFTDKDRLGLWFLWKFPLATSKQLGIVWGIKRASAHKRALALKELGLVSSEKIIGMTQLWFLTKRGYDVLRFHGVEDERVPRLYKAGSVRVFNLEHRLAITQVAAQLVGGVSDLQNHTPIPLPKGLEMLPLLVPEPYMNRTYGQMASRYDDVKDQTVIDADRAWKNQQSIAQEVESRRLKISDALAQNPGQWTLTTDYSSRSYGNQNHPVDLAIDLEAFRTDLKRPVSLGVEIELTMKSGKDAKTGKGDLERVINTIARQRERGAVPVFDRVIYMSQSKKIAAAVVAAAKKVGSERCFGVDVIRDADRHLYNGEAWRF